MIILLAALQDCQVSCDSSKSSTLNCTIADCVASNITKLGEQIQNESNATAGTSIPDFLYLRNVTLFGEIDTSNAQNLLTAHKAIFCERLAVEIELNNAAGDYKGNLFTSLVLHVMNANFVFRYESAASQLAISLTDDGSVALYQNVSINVFEKHSGAASSAAGQRSNLQTVIFSGGSRFESVYLVHDGTQQVPTGVTSVTRTMRVAESQAPESRADGGSIACELVYDLFCAYQGEWTLCYHYGANFAELDDNAARPLLYGYYDALISDACLYKKNGNEKTTLGGKTIESKNGAVPSAEPNPFQIQYLNGTAFQWGHVSYANRNPNVFFESLGEFEATCSKIGGSGLQNDASPPFCACYGTLTADGDCQCGDGFDEHCYQCADGFEVLAVSDDKSGRALSCIRTHKNGAVECTIDATGHFKCECAEGRVAEFDSCVVQVNQRALYIGLGCGILALLLICLVLGILISMRQKGARQLVYQMY